MNKMTPLDPVEELHANAAMPFEAARAMPKSVYTSEAFLAREIEDIFKADWFCVGRADMLKNPGDYTTLELAGQPIMVIRDKDGGLRAQSNVCRTAPRPSKVSKSTLRPLVSCQGASIYPITTDTGSGLTLNSSPTG